MTRYAENTSVSSEASRGEIERTLERYGADAFMYGWQDDNAIVGFRMNNRQVKFLLPLPARDDPTFTTYTSGRVNIRTFERSPDEARRRWEQACRQRWRALALVIKAKLEAVEAEISSFEEEFLAWTVLPNGTTAGAFLLPQVAAAYETGKMPPLLPAGKP